MPRMGDGDRESRPFSTLTAWILGLAALVAAITLLATNSKALYALFGDKTTSSRGEDASGSGNGAGTVGPPTSAVDKSGGAVTGSDTGTKPESGSTATAPQVFSSGDMVIRGTWIYDLDHGVEVSVMASGDVWWRQDTDTKRALQMLNGAQFEVIGQRDFDPITPDLLTQLSYSGGDIRGDNDVSNAIPTGTVVAYKTKAGRYGKLLIVEYGYNLKVKWVTFGS